MGDRAIIWRHRRGAFNLTQVAAVMGVLNVTPDSFSDGGILPTVEAALAAAEALEAAGADIIDIGGESTRPGSAPVELDEELARVVPVIRAVRQQSNIVISVDTMKAAVAEAALAAGADIINDVSGFRADADMVEVALEHRAGCVIMHMQGTPATMQQEPRYNDVVGEVSDFLLQRMAAMVDAGLDQERIALDPGIGFGKSPQHNLALFGATPVICGSGRPVLLGVSRKSFLGWLGAAPSIADRFWPGVALTSLGRELGGRVFRVHEPAPHVQALRMTEAITHAVAA